VFAHFCGSRVTPANDVVPSLTVAFQNLSTGAAEFLAVLLQTSKKDAIRGPPRDRVAEPPYIRAARGIFFRRATSLRRCGRSGNYQSGCYHQFADHFHFSLLLWPHASHAADAPQSQLAVGSFVASDSFTFIVA
jgi:hypothetical protein